MAPAPGGILAPIRASPPGYARGQGSDDRFCPGRCRPAGPLGLALVLV
jgi:hypothetical protein